MLDEIGDFPLALQPKLLCALEESAVRPVGSNREIRFDVRLITATNRDLEAAVATGQFREDLFYRINVIPIEMPPLRARSPAHYPLHDSEVRIDRKEFLHGPGMFFAEEITCKRIQPIGLVPTLGACAGVFGVR